MAEAIRGVVLNQGKVEINGASLNKYLVGLILITDNEVFPDKQEIVLTRASSLDIVGQSLSFLNLSTIDEPLGDLTNALFTVSEIDLDILEKI